jgi:hypothetical protein
MSVVETVPVGAVRAPGVRGSRRAETRCGGRAGSTDAFGAAVDVLRDVLIRVES